MSRWWRAYDEAVDDPKLCLLSDRAHRAWFNLMCVASAYGGSLPDIKVIALKLRMTPAKAQAAIDELRAGGLIDEVDGRLTPHNWNARQFKSDVTDPTNAERQKRYRHRNRNGPDTVTETVTVTPPRVQSTETEKKDAADAAPNLERELFERGKQVLGQDAGGLIAKLLKAKKKDVALARAAIETASTKQKPREYIGAVIAGGAPSGEGKRLTADEEYWGIGRIPGIV